jgi:hypothetical protein
MSLIEKAYFTLDEIEDRWQLPRRDVVYLAENGLLRLSVRLYDVRLERGYYEEMAEGDCARVPTDQAPFTGLQDLQEHDAFLLFRDGQAQVSHFAAPAPEYRCLLGPAESIAIREPDVVVRREERDSVETSHGLLRSGVAKGAGFRQLNDYAEVHCSGLAFHLGPVQARVVKRLHEAAVAGVPWCTGKTVLGDAGSACTRMADVFKSQRHWRRLIESDRRGHYRLQLQPD